MNTERNIKLDTGKIELNKSSITITVLVVAIILVGILAGELIGKVSNPRLSFDMDIGRCQKQCGVDNSGSDEDSISKKLNCQLACY